MAKQHNNDQLMQSLVDVFREYGYEGASLSMLSQHSGLGRSSLYHHFPNGKQDMAGAALDWVLAQFVEKVCVPLQDSRLLPSERLAQSCAGLIEFYASGERSCLINIFSVGHAATLFQSQLRDSVDGLSALYASLAEAGGMDQSTAAQRGQLAVMQIQGALVMTRALQDQRPFHAVVDALPLLLLQR